MKQNPFKKKTPLTAKLQPVINIVYPGEGRVFSIQVTIFSELGQGCGCENKNFLFPGFKTFGVTSYKSIQT